jgi:hypothetical protein
VCPLEGCKLKVCNFNNQNSVKMMLVPIIYHMGVRHEKVFDYMTEEQGANLREILQHVRDTEPLVKRVGIKRVSPNSKISQTFRCPDCDKSFYGSSQAGGSGVLLHACFKHYKEKINKKFKDRLIKDRYVCFMCKTKLPDYSNPTLCRHFGVKHNKILEVCKREHLVAYSNLTEKSHLLSDSDKKYFQATQTVVLRKKELGKNHTKTKGLQKGPYDVNILSLAAQKVFEDSVSTSNGPYVRVMN